MIVACTYLIWWGLLFFMKLIPLTQGKFAQVDDEDYDFLMQWKWQAVKDCKTYYAKRNLSVSENHKRGTLLMHRVILGITDPTIKGDHIDGNGLNNQRNNLRTANDTQNATNRSSRSITGFRGVLYDDRQENIYISARIWVSKKRIDLGYFKTVEEAAKAYDEAAIKYFGKYARLNFPSPSFQTSQ